MIKIHFIALNGLISLHLRIKLRRFSAMEVYFTTPTSLMCENETLQPVNDVNSKGFCIILPFSCCLLLLLHLLLFLFTSTHMSFIMSLAVRHNPALLTSTCDGLRFAQQGFFTVSFYFYCVMTQSEARNVEQAWWPGERKTGNNRLCLWGKEERRGESV